MVYVRTTHFIVSAWLLQCARVQKSHCWTTHPATSFYQLKTKEKLGSISFFMPHLQQKYLELLIFRTYRLSIHFVAKPQYICKFYFETFCQLVYASIFIYEYK